MISDSKYWVVLLSFALQACTGEVTGSVNDIPYDLSSDDQHTFESMTDDLKPSGLIYVPDYTSFFMVDDGGVVVRLSQALDVLPTWTVEEWPRRITEYVYAALSDSFTSQRSFDPSSVIACAGANSCLEAVAFVPSSASSEGGLFYSSFRRAYFRRRWEGKTSQLSPYVDH